MFQICAKNIVMEKEKYELFAMLLEEEKVYMDPGMTFRKICRWIGADVRQMDSYLESELGYSGNETLESYRRISARRFMDRYGIGL